MSFRVPERYRLRTGPYATTSANGNNGAFQFKSCLGATLRIIASDGMGWEHVSISTANRVPQWREMCEVKDFFWDLDDWVVQFHPAATEYVNFHPHCLHLWRPVGGWPPGLTPPAWMVGPVKGDPDGQQAR